MNADSVTPRPGGLRPTVTIGGGIQRVCSGEREAPTLTKGPVLRVIVSSSFAPGEGSGSIRRGEYVGGAVCDEGRVLRAMP